MIITLLKQDRIHTLALPNKVSGRYWLQDLDMRGKIRNLISIEAYEGQWMMSSNPKVDILKTDQAGQVDEKVILEPLSLYGIRIKETNNNAFVFVEAEIVSRKQYTKYSLYDNSEVSIGRDESNDIVYDNKYVSSRHAKITYANKQWKVDDLGSANGTFVDTIREKSKILAPGSCICIMGLKIIVGDTFIAVNNPNDNIHINNNKLKPYNQPDDMDNADVVSRGSSKEDEYFYITPRFKSSIKAVDIKIDPPPPEVKLEKVPIALVIGPSLTMGMASMFTASLALSDVMSGVRTLKTALPTLVMSVSMMIGTVLWPMLSKRYERKQKVLGEKKRKEKYLKYLDGIKDMILDECRNQAAIMNATYISLSECVNRVMNRERSLWERTSAHDDFLHVRLGKGQLPLLANISYPEKRFTMEDDLLQKEMYKIAEVPKIVRDVPITYSLAKTTVSGIIGDRKYTLSSIKGLITQITALHSYEEVKLVILFPEKEREQWSFAKWLPHTWDNSMSIRYMASNVYDAKELSVLFEKEIMIRQEDQSDNKPLPHYVIISADKELASKCTFIQNLLNYDDNIGFSIIALYDEINHLPKECSTVIDFSQDRAKIYDKYDLEGKVLEFNPEYSSEVDFDEYSEKLGTIKLNLESQSFVMPKMLTFLDMFGVNQVEHLNSLTRWRDNEPTISLQTPIGVDDNGGISYLDLHEKFHGPHGLIAGMTGSGKSEFIITYIMSLAVNYHPNEVAFILIDYKGGGLTGAFENERYRLPHLAGTITNLDGASIQRSLLSIQSELRRRQAIFNEARRIANEGTMDIYLYQKLYRTGVVKEPLPHLFIISDEFAELKAQQPEFMQQLISAARIGRSLGVHLILATQKPSGVVDDQIWSNSRFRVCLKVQETADSIDMIKRPDAAALSITGRYYLQVGFNEIFELGQSAWCGAPYIPEKIEEQDKDCTISMIDDIGRVVKQKKLSKAIDSKSRSKQNVEILRYLCEIAAEEGVRTRTLWLEAIPKIIYLEKLKEKYGYSFMDYVLNPVVGEYDDPYNQKQDLLTLPISRDGNVLLYGSTGSGKSDFITTMIYGLIGQHSPEHLNIYALDFGSETLTIFSRAPQVGDIIVASEEEKVKNLLKMLEGKLAERKKLFVDYGGSYEEYCKNSKKAIANILVIINNYSSFSEIYSDYEDSLSVLTRDGTKYGIYFMITASNTNAVRYRMLQNFKQILTLQLNDKSEYVGILGNTEGVVPSQCKGRGLVKYDRAYEFQTACISDNTSQSNELIVKLCGDLQKVYEIKAEKVPVLPDFVSPELFAEDKIRIDRLPVGIDKSSMKTITINLAKNCIIPFISQDEDQSDVLQAMAELATRDIETKIVVLDIEESFNRERTMEYDYHYDDLEDYIAKWFDLVVYRHNSYKASAGKITEDMDFYKILYIIPSIDTLFSRLSDDRKDKLKLILEKSEADFNIHIILSSSSSRYATMTHEPWYRKHCTSGNGIWIGDGFTERMQISVNRVTKELYQPIGPAYAIVVQKGRYNLVKVVSVEEREDELV